MAPFNIIRSAYPEDLKSVSKQHFCVAGLSITVYGLEELSKDCEPVACLWLLHPRLCEQAYMEPIASSAISKWKDYVQRVGSGKRLPGLIAVSFDQRNHGTREINKIANLDWVSGNESHAQDMFAGYRKSRVLHRSMSSSIANLDGTAIDASHLMTYIPSYIFPEAEHQIIKNVTCGVSLGGHAAWLSLMSDPRVCAAIVVVGCPDYITLISERAERSGRTTAGPSFLGSKDFPENLLEAVRSFDPAGQLIGVDSRRLERLSRDPISDERASISPIMYQAFQGKRLLNMAGTDDTLVPYSCAEPFLRWLKKVSGPGGFFEDADFHIEDVVFENVGHWLSPGMTQKLDEFLIETLKVNDIDRSSRL